MVPASILVTLGWVLLWILVGLLALLGLIVALPVHLRAQGSVDEEGLDGSVRGTWGWFLLGLRLSPAGVTLHVLGIRIWTFKGDSLGDAPKKSKKKKKTKEKDEAKKPRSRMGWLWTHRRTLKRLLGRVVRAFRLRLRVTGVVGLGDPADTSMAQQLWTAADHISPNMQVHIAPEWLENQVELQGEFRMRIWLLHLLGIGLMALIRKDTRTMLRAARAARA